MTLTPSQMLAEFHQTFEVDDLSAPGIPDRKVVTLRQDLLGEEYSEYVEASDNDDLVEVADALADIVYIAFGTARSYGIDLDAVLAEVHRTNMAKAPGGVVKRREDGKVLKPEGWTPPDIAGVLGVAAQ